MRAGPGKNFRVVSQALFGERVEVLKKGEWSLIRTPDGYEGWVQSPPFDRSEYRTDVETSRLAAHLYEIPDTEFGPLLTLPYGSGLSLIQEIDERWLEIELVDGKKAFIQRGDVEKIPFDCRQFLGIAYTWGGRSSFGFDCSGFVQMVYRKRGIFLPRDARQQILVPTKDLIFWGKSETDIRHVGILLNREEFIHTSSRENRPYLRISKLSDPAWRGDEHYPFISVGGLNGVSDRQKGDRILGQS